MPTARLDGRLRSGFIGSDVVVVAGGSLLKFVVYLNTNALER